MCNVFSSLSTQNQTRTARMATRQDLSNQANQVGVCFVLNDYSDDPDTSAFLVGQNVPLPTESVKQTPFTPTAAAAVDIKKGGIFYCHAMDDNDEPWLSKTDHRTCWNKEFKSGTYRGMLYGIVLRDYPKHVVLFRRVCRQTCVNFSLGHRNYRIDVTASIVERKTGEPTSAGPCPGGCKDFTHKGSNARFIRMTCKICGTVRSEERHPPRQDPASCSHRHTDHRGSNAHKRKTYCVDCGTYSDSVPRKIYNALEAARSASSNSDEEFADRVLKDTTITKRQLYLATRLMLEQVSRMSDWIMSSQRWFNFSWIALTAQLCHPLHSFRSENNTCISMLTKH